MCNLVTDQGLVTVLASLGGTLESLRLFYVTQLTDVTLQAVAQYCPRLRVFDVNFCRLITDSGLLAVARNCPALTVVLLEACGLVSDAAVLAFAEHCPQLQELAAPFSTDWENRTAGMTADGVRAFVARATSLELLHLPEGLRKEVMEQPLAREKFLTYVFFTRRGEYAFPEDLRRDMR